MGVGIPESSLDFSFGFDDPNFSDRILRLEIAENGPHTKKPCLPHTTTPPGPEPRVKTIQICSLILAVRSPFFRTLFSNGMRESGQKLVTLRIETSEEDSLMDLLKYVYSNTLPTTLHALLHLLVIADKFEVASCFRACTRLLQSMPMTCKSSSLYLELPPSLLISPTIQPLIDAAKQFLVARFNDFDKCKEEMINLSLAGIQAVLSSDDLQVTSEGVVYNAVLKWARKHYPDSEERRGILKAHLLDLVRFPFMTPRQLIEEVQTCNDIDPELASQIVIRALYFKAETPHLKHCLEGNAASRQLVERAYKYRPVKVVELESPHQHCIVFLHFKRKELLGMISGGDIMSEAFHLGKQQLCFVARYYLNKRTLNGYFLMALKVVGSAANFPVKYEIGSREKSSGQFACWVEGRHTFTEEQSLKCVAYDQWSFIDEETYFINNVLYLRAELMTEK